LIGRRKPCAALWTSLGTALYASGRIAEGASAYSRAIELDNCYAPALSNRLFGMHLDERLAPESIADEHFAWGQRVAASIRPRFDFSHRDRRASRPLRIGVLSSDLRTHSIVYFLAAILENIDSSRFPMTVFSNVTNPDSTTERLKGVGHRWLDVSSLDADECAEVIYNEKIDILIEVGGHTSPDTLAVLARKPAPIQIAYLAYPDTTGLSAVDYVLTDSIADPPGMTEHLYTERLLRLDPCALCYKPPEASPAVKPRPVEGPVVFGCFAQRQKLSSRTLSLWASILRRAPDSRLLLKAQAWRDARLCAELREWFAVNGVEQSRIDFVAHLQNVKDHLELYNRVDIGLDTFPYSGITTTCEALWMGVPVVALAGRTQVSRLCTSILHAARRPELAARGDAEYVQTAVELAADPHRLHQARLSLRNSVSNSPLLDGAAFAARVEETFGEIWRCWLID
jgi:protein O-GlcNAc transferase